MSGPFQYGPEGIRKRVAIYWMSCVHKSDARKEILDRLASDPDQKVSGAFTHLQPPHPLALIQRIEVAALSALDPSLKDRQAAAEQERLQKAEQARDLAEFLHGVPVLSTEDLEARLYALADELERSGQPIALAAAIRSESRKHLGDEAQQIRALRALGNHVLQMRSSSRFARGDREAIRNLIEAALGVSIPASRVAEALRR